MFEIVIVILVTGVLVLTVVPFLSTGLGRNELQRSSWEVVDALRQARQMSRNGRLDDQWGVHVQSGEFSLFKGPTYNQAEENTQTTDLSGYVSIDQISLNGGGSDVLFDKFSGTTSTHGTIRLTDVQTGTSRIVFISEEGFIEEN